MASGIDWLSEEVPTQVEQFVLELLLEMVFVHNEVIQALPVSVAFEVLSVLADNIFQTFLDGFHQIPYFGTGGLQTVRCPYVGDN